MSTASVSPQQSESGSRSPTLAALRAIVEAERAHRLWAPLVFVFIATTAAIVAWCRFLPANRDILWAEDGRNFLQDAINTGPFGSLLAPYAGYLHTIPRLIAGLTVALAPVSDYALWMTAGSCIAAGIMAAIVFTSSSAMVGCLPARLMLAALTVLVPLAPREVLGNAANLHSLVMWTLCWLLVYRPRTRFGGISLAVFALLGAMTEIQAVALLPLLVFRGKNQRRWFVRGAYLLGIAAQLCVTVLWPRHHNSTPLIGPPSLFYGYMFNSSLSVWVSQQDAGRFAAREIAAYRGELGLARPASCAAIVGVSRSVPSTASRKSAIDLDGAFFGGITSAFQGGYQHHTETSLLSNSQRPQNSP